MWERRGGHVDVTEPGRAPSSAGAADFLARFDGDLEAAIAALRAAAGTGTPATTAPIPTPRRPARPRSGRALIDVTDLRKTYTVGRQKIQALDGVSLTIVDVVDDVFSVALIPHTSEVTTLGVRSPGDAVNLEVDVMAKYAERLLSGVLDRTRSEWEDRP